MHGGNSCGTIPGRGCCLSRCGRAGCLRGTICNTPYGNIARDLKESVNVESKLLVALAGCVLDSSYVVNMFE